MINFPVLRTKRLTVQLRELSIGESIAIAAMPVHLEEACCTAFLRYAVTNAADNDPAHWTVQERMMTVCHYLAATTEDGPDFSVGNGHYSDYLDSGEDINAPPLGEIISIGDIGGDSWHLRHLTGAMAESIERLSGEIQGIPERLHWILGGMAAQLVRKDESVPDPVQGEGAFDEFLLKQMRIFAAYPESDFAALMNAYLTGREKLSHLFKIEFSDDGLVAIPKGGLASGLPPARFPVRSCLSGLATQLVRKPNEHGLNA